MIDVRSFTASIKVKEPLELLVVFPGVKIAFPSISSSSLHVFDGYTCHHT